MTKTLTTTRARIVTCLVVLAVVFATFLAGTFTSSAATDNVFESVELKVGDTLGFVYYTSQPYTANTTMRFEINGRTSTVKAYPNNGKCVFVFNDIYPHEIAKNLKATIVVNGVDASTKTGLSVKSFLLDILGDSKQSKLHEFASNLLQYGEQTRIYRNAHVASNLRDDVSILNDIEKYSAYSPKSLAADFTGTPNGLGMSASNIRMSAIGISYYNTNQFVITLKQKENTVIDISKVSVTIDGKTYNTFTKIDNTTYELESDPINAYDLLKSVSITLKYDGVTAQSASYSVRDYILQLQETTESYNAARLYAKSLFYYGEAAQEAYPGKSVVAMTLKSNPSNITVTNKNAQTPTGGSATVYYSDGTTASVNVTWSSVSGITDTTYSVTRATTGSYKDPVSQKTFQVSGQVKLLNPSKSIARWTDPDIYAPTSYAASYTPTTGTVRVTYSNGATANVKPTYSAINMSSYKTTEFANIAVTASWTHPTTSTKHTVTMYQEYQNPAKSMTAKWTGGTVTFTGGKNTHTPNTSKVNFKITYTNGQTSGYVSVGNATYDANNSMFSISNASYDGTATSGTLNHTATYAAKSFSVTKYSNGSSSTVSRNRDKLTDNAKVASGETSVTKIPFSNPEASIAIASLPTATISSPTAPTTANGMLSGGSITVTMANGAKKTVTSGVSFTCRAGHNTTDYTASVKIYATYNGMTSSDSYITLYNPVKSVTQADVTTVGTSPNSTGTSNFSVSIGSTIDTLLVTYANNTTTRATATYFRLGTSGSNYSTVYPQNITGAEEGPYTRTTAASGANSTSRSALKVYYADNRSGSSYTTVLDYSIKIVNPVSSITASSSPTITLTSSNASTTSFTGSSYITSVQATYTNGATGSIKPTSVANITNSPSATERKSVSVTATYKNASNSNKTCSVTVYIVNPITGIARWTDPSTYKVSNTSALTSANILNNGAGSVLATFTSGHTGAITPTGFESLTNCKLTTALIGQFDITAYYSSSYTSKKTCAVKIILTNPPKDATASISGVGSSTSNRLTLSKSAVSVSGSGTITLNNGQTIAASSCTWQSVYKGGTNSSSASATTNETGSCTLTATVKSSASSTYYPYSSGSNGSGVSVAAATYSPTDTAYWKNNPSSITAVSGSGEVLDFNTTQITPTATVKVTYTNGASCNRTATGCTKVANITDTTYQASRTTTATYTANGVSKTCDVTFTLSNYATSYSVGSSTYYMSGSTTRNISIGGTVHLKNNRTPYYSATSISLQSSSGSGSFSASSTLSYTNTSKSVQSGAATCVAYYSGHGGIHSSQFTITVRNWFSKIEVFTKSDYTDKFFMTNTTDQEAYYPRFTMSGPSTISACRTYGSSSSYGNTLYIRITYDNGNTWDTTWNGYSSSSYFSWSTAPTHYAGYVYRDYKDNYTADSLQKVTMYVVEGDDSAYVDFYCVPYATYTSNDYVQATKVKDTPGSDSLGGDDFTLTYSKRERRTFSNGYSRNIDQAGITTGTSNSNGWYWGRTTIYTYCNNDGAACANGNSKYYFDDCIWSNKFTGNVELVWQVDGSGLYGYGTSSVSDLSSGKDDHDLCAFLCVRFPVSTYAKSTYLGVGFSWYKANYSNGATTVWSAPNSTWEGATTNYASGWIDV